MKFHDIPVGRKLWACLLATLMAVTLAAVTSQSLADAALRQALAEVERHDAQITRVVRWQGLTHAATQGSVASALSADSQALEHFAKRDVEIVGAINALQKEIVHHAALPQEKRALEQAGEGRKAVRAVLQRIEQARKDGGTPAALALGELVPAVERYLHVLGEVVKLQERLRDEAKAAALAHGEHVARWGWLSMAVVVALGVTGVAWLVRSIVRPLEETVDAARRIAAGDLTHRLRGDRGDEVGRLMQAMAQMSQRLQDVVSEVRHGVDSVNTASAEIATGNQDLSGRTEQMAASLQQSASAMEELTATVSQSADTAHQANELAVAAAASADRGGEAVSQVEANMERISEGSRRIADIIGVIDGIAFQTNILALNAAVEAARAGEQGRGFAVVAGEVRSLAQRSAEAAKEIKTLITASVATVESGSALVAQTGSAMQAIRSDVQRVSALIAEIAAATGEQRDGIAQVNQAVGDLDRVTQQNAALVEESAAAAQSLRQQAQRLAQGVAVFNVGAVAAAPSQPATAPQAQARAALHSGAPAVRAVRRPPVPVAHATADEEAWTTF